MTRSYTRSLFFFFFFCLGSFLTCHAQDGAASIPKIENRFLFIVDVSSAMSRSSVAAQKAVADLIASGMQDQLRDGDTLGIWTYNDELHTDFPMQVWSDLNRQAILDNSVSYLRTLRYGKKSRLDRVLPLMFSVMRSSRTLTVVLVSDGTGLMQGTKFDKAINAYYKEYQRPMRDANLPFLTVLAAKGGDVFDYAVDSSLGPIRMPITAEPRKKIEPVAVKPPASVPSPKPREIRRIDIGATVPKTNGVIEAKPVAPAVPLITEAKAGSVTSSDVPAPGGTGAGDTNTPAAPAASSSNSLPPLVAQAPPSVTMLPAVQEAATPVPVPAVTTPGTEESKKAPAQITENPAAPEMIKLATGAVESEKARLSAVAPLPTQQQPTAVVPSYYSRLLLIVACLCLVMGAAIIILLVYYLRRGRSGQPSIISQSIKRTGEEEKP